MTAYTSADSGTFKVPAWRACLLPVLLCLLLTVSVSFSAFAQEDSNDVLIDPVIALNKTIKSSTGLFENVLPYPGKVYGLGAEGQSFIMDIEPRQKFELEVNGFDSLLFNFEWLLSDNSPYEVNYYISSAENIPFVYEDVVFEAGLSSNGSIVSAKKINAYKGRRLYDLVISDDVKPFRIKVTPLPESSPYIDVVQSADSSRFQIRLKRSSEIDALIQQDMGKFRSQGYAEFPIGVIMTDPEIPLHNKPLKFTLRQKIKKTNRK